MSSLGSGIVHGDANEIFYKVALRASSGAITRSPLPFGSFTFRCCQDCSSLLFRMKISRSCTKKTEWRVGKARDLE